MLGPFLSGCAVSWMLAPCRDSGGCVSPLVPTFQFLPGCLGLQALKSAKVGTIPVASGCPSEVLDTAVPKGTKAEIVLATQDHVVLFGMEG